ncbi:MAG: flavodoxin family protein [Lachnospiraceae bacterium]|jgi:flavodoxin I|nr:flavodoxin family protein [Lachnospiraceae bacterium]
MRTLVIYASETGNTKMVAESIFSALGSVEKDMYPIGEWKHDLSADLYIIGFWNNRGTCGIDVMNLLSELHGKKVAVFGTCGMGNDEEYFHTVEENVTVWIPDDCVYMGCFLCQGKMPIRVRQRYESLRSEENSARIDRCISLFDEALLHPDEKDLANAAAFAGKLI